MSEGRAVETLSSFPFHADEYNFFLPDSFLLVFVRHAEKAGSTSVQRWVLFFAFVFFFFTSSTFYDQFPQRKVFAYRVQNNRRESLVPR